MTNEAEKPTILDAVNAALDPLIEKEPEPVTPDPDADAPEGDEPAGDAPAGGKTPGDASEGGEPAETPEQKTARETAEAEARANETSEQKTARETAEAAAKKPLDPVNDPIPATVAPRTKERITSLIGTVKELQPFKERYEEVMGHITNTGASPEEFATMLSYMRLIHSDKIEDRRVAYKMIEAELKGLAPHIGEVLPGEDPLAGYPDLQNAVAAQSITQEHANEIAKYRSHTKANDAAGEQTVAQQRAAQEFETAKQAGIKDLNDWEIETRKADTQYEQKKALILPALKPVLAQLHPSRWKAAWAEAYKNVKVAAPVARPAAPANGGKPAAQPLRPNKQPASGGAVAQPKSLLEAVNASLKTD